MKTEISSEEYKEKLELMLGALYGMRGIFVMLQRWGSGWPFVRREAQQIDTWGMSTELWISSADIKSTLDAAKNDPNFTIESAKSLIAQWFHEGVATYKVSKIR